MESRKYVEADKALRRHLSEVFCVGEKTVYNALHYVGDSDLCRRIRTHALQKGGCVMVVLPEEEFLSMRRRAASS